MCGEIYEKYLFPVATVHDCLIVPVQHEKITRELIKKHCLKHIAHPPNLKTEPLDYEQAESESLSKQERIESIKGAVKKLNRELRQLKK